jgi:hypothetical protein
MLLNRQICLPSGEEREKFPYDETIVLYTESGNEGSISDAESLMNDISSLCCDSDEPLVRKLEPVTSVEVLTNRKEVFIQGIEFAGYDTADTLLETEDPDDEKEYANEKIKNNMLTASWQPNFFRPIVRIMGRNLASNLSNPFPGRNYHNLSIGLPLPFCLNINKVVTDTSQLEIDVRASLCQLYKSGGVWKFRNYPLQAILTIWHNTN